MRVYFPVVAEKIDAQGYSFVWLKETTLPPGGFEGQSEFSEFHLGNFFEVSQQIAFYKSPLVRVALSSNRLLKMQAEVGLNSANWYHHT